MGLKFRKRVYTWGGSKVCELIPGDGARARDLGELFANLWLRSADCSRPLLHCDADSQPCRLFGPRWLSVMS